MPHKDLAERRRYNQSPARQAYMVEYRKRWYAANREKVRAQNKAWREDNPEKYAEYMRRAYPKKKAQERAKHLAMRNAAGTRPRPDSCEVCKRHGAVWWDHNHQTGKFRGWLCRHCNWALGHAKDSSELLRALATYLDDANAVRQ